MHGSPLLRTLLVTLALLVTGIPLWRLTHGGGVMPQAAPAAPAPAAGEKARIEAAFSRQPLRFEVSSLGKPIWTVEHPAGSIQSREVTLPRSKAGIDLEYRVEWPPGSGLSAARLSVALGEADPIEKTLWGTDKIDDVLTFP